MVIYKKDKEKKGFVESIYHSSSFSSSVLLFLPFYQYLDSFSGLRLLNPANTSNDSKFYNFSTTGIAWPSDRQRYKPTQMPVESITPPPNWVRRYQQYTSNNIFNPQEDEHFQVWMRTSWYPTFRKLYSHYSNGGGVNVAPLEPGSYQIQVDLSKLIHLFYFYFLNIIIIMKKNSRY